MRKAVKVIAILATVGSIVYFIAAVILLSNREMQWSTFLITIISAVLSLILLWVLHGSLLRIEKLEESKKKDKQLKSDSNETTDTNNKLYKILHPSSSSETKKAVKASDKPLKQCKACGAIERTNEDRCPMCNTPYEESQNKKKLTK